MSASSSAALAAVESIPRDADGPVFGAPWQAHAFAMAVTLQARGLFSWAEWAEALGASRASAAASGESDTGEAYYRDWLAALEAMVSARGIADAGALTRTREAWGRAAARTPHGAAIELRAWDFR